ncbi:MAG: phospho-N-acetylmuramoyl-pentapeptide-transferase [Planctomycetota bacterium]
MLYLLLEQLEAWLGGVELPGGLTLYSFVRVLDQIEFRSLAAAGLSFLVVVLAGPATIRKLRQLKIGDTGSTDADLLRATAKSKANVPTMGGVLIAAAIFGSTLLLADITQQHVYIGLFVLLWMSVLGGVDDWLKLTAVSRGTGRQGLHAWEKLVFQIALALIVGYFVGTEDGELARAVTLPFQRTYQPPGYAVNPALIVLPVGAFMVLSVLMIAGLSNAVNITDGMDGLASGLTSSVAVGLMVLCLIGGNPDWAQGLLVPYIPLSNELAVLTGAMLGACLGFLWWNCSPAQVFMGDTGSLCLGGLIGYIGLVLRQEFVVLVMCGVFLFEILSVVMQVGYFKATGGKRIFRCAPYHHHLHLLGWTEQQVVSRLWIVGVVLVVIGLTSLKLR